MRVVNPVGRKAETEISANSVMRACMCSSGMADARTSADNCTHCGCSCSSDQFSVGNYQTASKTNRITYA